MIEITGLCKSYDSFSLGPIDLHLKAGTAYGLVGPNGAGKSTLFRCIMGTVRKDNGLVRIGGKATAAGDGGWKQQIGYTGDYTPLFEHWTGAENLQAFSDYYQSWSEEKVEMLASRLDLDLSQAVGKYSTGQNTKLATILALAHNPDVLLLDEPANGLDPIARDVFMELLFEQMQNEDLTILYATHHISEIEHLADELIFISSGQILKQESTENLSESWRRITFRSCDEIGGLPNEVVRITQGQEYEVTSSDYQKTLRILERIGVESIETSKLTTEQICVHILKNTEDNIQ